MKNQKYQNWLKLPSKYLRLVVTGFLLVIILLATVLMRQPASGCGPYRSDRVVSVGSQKINAEVVSTPNDLAKGLSGRTCIDKDQAMLFIFNQSARHYFWMKGMKFPIDIVWVNEAHKAVAAQEDVKPSSYPATFSNSSAPAKYALEMQAHRSRSLGIRLGTYVQF